jgi:hypothetical protein
MLLDDRNLKMSARYAMSDFEIGIRSAIENSFGGNIVCKGYNFHFAQAVFRQVVKKGFKVQYSEKKNEIFSGFNRAAIGFAYVPLFQKLKKS